MCIRERSRLRKRQFINLAGLISHPYPLAATGEAFEALAANEASVVKSTIEVVGSVQLRLERWPLCHCSRADEPSTIRAQRRAQKARWRPPGPWAWERREIWLWQEMRLSPAHRGACSSDDPGWLGLRRGRGRC